jgi:hypothetical protein
MFEWWVDGCVNSALPHPSLRLGKERGQEDCWTIISQPWEEWLQYITEGAE